MQKLLITGASGFVGEHLLRELAGSNKNPNLQVLCVDRTLPVERAQKLNTDKLQLKRLVLEITDALGCEKVVDEFAPDACIHLAGVAFGPEAERDFAKVITINVAGTFNICRALSKYAERENKNVAFLHVSSAEVYGRPESLPVTHTSAVLPNNAYGLTKLQSELVVQQAHRNGSLCCAIARPFNHLGRGQNEQFVAPAFAKQIAEIEKGISPAVLSVGNLEAERDFCDVRDVVRGYVSAIQWLVAQSSKIESELPEIFVFCSGKPVPVKKILSTFQDLSKVHFTVEADPKRMRPAEVPQVYGSYENAKQLLGWYPKIELTATLRDVMDDWRERVTV